MLAKRNRLVSTSIVLIIGLLFLAHRTIFFKSGMLESCASTISYPFIVIAHHCARPVHALLDHCSSYHTLEKNVQSLQEICARLSQENIALHAQLRHAKLTEELATFKEQYANQAGVLSRILVKNFSDDEHYYLVNQGSFHGITPDSIALYNNQILGRVAQVYPLYCKVLLITDQHCKVAATCARTDARGIVHGTHQLDHCKLAYLSHLASVELHDLVLSSGQGLLFPEGFALGTIIAITKDELCYNIDIKPTVDLAKLDYCLLVNKNQLN